MTTGAINQAASVGGGAPAGGAAREGLGNPARGTARAGASAGSLRAVGGSAARTRAAAVPGVSTLSGLCGCACAFQAHARANCRRRGSPQGEVERSTSPQARLRGGVGASVRAIPGDRTNLSPRATHQFGGFGLMGVRSTAFVTKA